MHAGIQAGSHQRGGGAGLGQTRRIQAHTIDHICFIVVWVWPQNLTWQYLCSVMIESSQAHVHLYWPCQYSAGQFPAIAGMQVSM